MRSRYASPPGGGQPLAHARGPIVRLGASSKWRRYENFCGHRFNLEGARYTFVILWRQGLLVPGRLALVSPMKSSDHPNCVTSRQALLCLVQLISNQLRWPLCTKTCLRGFHVSEKSSGPSITLSIIVCPVAFMFKITCWQRKISKHMVICGYRQWSFDTSGHSARCGKKLL